ncbi:hypothetical protein BEWA_023460 [Theileria equi strain WA]|uniref:Uncharacterized protein n=1 Tax=Theileria equi strain WA TaxID=1537102 RepID=L0AV61_THEEQ|nr:hypothetical protein BEWA_023460 [Theileria equi strain WA]AFZ79497.1 hypothetical protein BEWA_023460 [Theileria equi strain WA]|eukprot:XP_004829163.1 hypothetical protein BEWA_023460 [Theileria equi strain WA]
MGTIDEFMKKTTDLVHLKLSRATFDIELSHQRTNNLVHVTSTTSMEPSNSQENSEIRQGANITSTHYSVRPEMQFYVTIGVVKYNGHVIESRNDGLLNREVVWKHGMYNQNFTIISRYNDGMSVEDKYNFTYDGEVELE